MLRDLWNRWGYVESIKELSWDEHTGTAALPTPDDLAAAFNRYPQRREVPFIYIRASRLLAFDDNTKAFNQYAAAFLAKIDINNVVARYGRQSAAAPQAASIDPILFLARLEVEASRVGASSVETAIKLVRDYRGEDSLGKAFLIIYENELADRLPEANPDKLKRYEALFSRTEDLIDSLRNTSANEHLQVVMSPVYQELLDVSAQLYARLAHKMHIDALHEVPKRYVRILTLRKQVASTADAPWLESPGKLSIYQLFKHEAGRPSDITNEVIALHRAVPGLREALKVSILDADAFKAFKDLDTWDKGTPLSSNYAGSGMRDKLIEWLKRGW